MLDALPEYFDDLRALRRFDEDAYAIFARLGGVMAFGDSLFSRMVEPRFVEAPPHIRCVFLRNSGKADPDDKGNLIAPTIYMMRMAGGQVCVGRDGGVVTLPRGLCYRVSVAWRLDHQSVGDSFYVHIADNGKVNLLPERRSTFQRLPRGGGFHSTITRHSPILKDMAGRHGMAVEDKAAELVAITMSCERPKSAILVRAHHGDMTAAWTIDKRDAKRFFAKRETSAASDGRRKRVLHYVGEFTRRVGDTVQEVRAHYRGERVFDWNGYRIEVSGLGFHHGDFFDADIEGFEDDGTNDRRLISSQRASEKIRQFYSRPHFLSSKRRAA